MLGCSFSLKKAKTSNNAVFAFGAGGGSPYPKNLTIFREPKRTRGFDSH